MEAGRVAYVNFGEDYGKLCTIVDIVDENKVLVDGEHFPRVIYPMRRLTLTKFRLPVLRGARTSTLLKAAKKYDLAAKWAACPAAKKFAIREKRANLNDLERFAVMVNRKRRAFAVRKIAKSTLRGSVKKVVAKKVAAKK